MEDETIEDVRAAYALLHRDMAALRAKADALFIALDEMLDDIGRANSLPSAIKARAAIANYTGA